MGRQEGVGQGGKVVLDRIEGAPEAGRGAPVEGGNSRGMSLITTMLVGDGSLISQWTQGKRTERGRYPRTRE